MQLFLFFFCEYTMWNPPISGYKHLVIQNIKIKREIYKKKVGWKKKNFILFFHVTTTAVVNNSVGLCGILDFGSPRCLSLAELALYPIVTEHFLLLLRIIACSFTYGENVATSLSQTSLTVNYLLSHLDLSPCSSVWVGHIFKHSLISNSTIS